MNIKQWIIGKENILVKKEEYDTLLEQLDIKNKEIVRLTKEYEDSQQKFKRLQQDHDVLNYTFKEMKIELDDLKHEYTVAKDYNTKVTFNVEENRKWGFIKGESTRTTGLIKHNGDTYMFTAILADGKQIRKYGDLNKCKRIYDTVQKTGLKNISDLNHFNEITHADIVVHRSHDLPLALNRSHAGFTIAKKNVNFGYYTSINKALRAYDYLVFKEWDINLSCKKLKPTGRMRADEIYNKYLLGFINVDIPYREYWRDRGGLSIQNIAKKWDVDLSKYGE